MRRFNEVILVIVRWIWIFNIRIILCVNSQIIMYIIVICNYNKLENKCNNFYSQILCTYYYIMLYHMLVYLWKVVPVTSAIYWQCASCFIFSFHRHICWYYYNIVSANPCYYGISYYYHDYLYTNKGT